MHMEDENGKKLSLFVIENVGSNGLQSWHKGCGNFNLSNVRGDYLLIRY